MTEDEMDLLAAKIADAITAKRDTTTHDQVDLAKTVTAAMREAVRRGKLPKNLLGDL